MGMGNLNRLLDLHDLIPTTRITSWWWERSVRWADREVFLRARRARLDDRWDGLGSWEWEDGGCCGEEMPWCGQAHVAGVAWLVGVPDWTFVCGGCGCAVFDDYDDDYYLDTDDLGVVSRCVKE